MTRKKPFPGVTEAIDRHGKRRWRLRKTVKGRRIDTYLPGAYGSAEFREAYYAAIDPAASPAPRSVGAVGTFEHVIAHYRASKSFADLAASTRYAKGKRLDWIAGLIGAARLADLMPHHVENLMDRKGGNDAANRLRKEISEMYTHARKRMGLQIPDPTGEVCERKTRKEGFHTWTEDEIDQFLRHHGPGSKARLALFLILNTGAARQDVARLGWQNVTAGRIRYRRGKTGVEADLPIMPELAEELRHVPRDRLIFLATKDGKPHTAPGFGNWFGDQCRAAGLAHCAAHGLRKAGAVRLAEAGASEHEIMAYLAHATPREAATYTKQASRPRLTDSGFARMNAGKKSENVSNLTPWLDKKAKQDTEKKGKK